MWYVAWGAPWQRLQMCQQVSVIYQRHSNVRAMRQCTQAAHLRFFECLVHAALTGRDNAYRLGLWLVEFLAQGALTGRGNAYTSTHQWRVGVEQSHRRRRRHALLTEQRHGQAGRLLLLHGEWQCMHATVVTCKLRQRYTMARCTLDDGLTA